MFILGLTGSVGMGKSVTARFFAEAGVPVHDADAVVHRLYEGEAVAAIETAFPGTTVTSTTGVGKVDRAKLAARVLGDATALKRLEAIVHPLVQKDERRLLAEANSEAWLCSIFRCCSKPGRPAGRRRRGRLGATGGAARARAPRHDRGKARRDPCEKMPDAEKRRRAVLSWTSRGFDAAREQVRAILAAVATMPKPISRLRRDGFPTSFRPYWVAYARNRARHRSDRP
jgi:dephospho-CoA kinase